MMKYLLTCLFVSSFLVSICQSSNNAKKSEPAASRKGSIHIPDTTKKIQIVDAACGECQFHMPGKGCHLAVRIQGKSYFVDGTDIDSHGDAHAEDGFCEATRKAEVQGEIINNRFKATYFKLIVNASKQKDLP